MHMAFVKRPLNPDEHSRLDLAALGIETSRIPPREWDWAVDEERNMFCTQLISNTYQMREGWYWYLLLVSGTASVFKVDAFAEATVDGHPAREAELESSVCPTLALTEIKQLAREAHKAVSFQGEDLKFLPNSTFPE
jgi:hypothetical protein